MSEVSADLVPTLSYCARLVFGVAKSKYISKSLVMIDFFPWCADCLTAYDPQLTFR